MRRAVFALAFISIAISYSHLHAQILLDEVMSNEDQKKTGVVNLTKDQKIALEAWIDQNFTLKAKPKAPETELSLSINIDKGQKLQLSDNSLWEISPDDVSTSSVWLTPVPIKITPSGDLNYPCLIIDQNSGISVKARRISPPPSAARQIKANKN